MADEEDFSKLPLPEQFAHKNWKARKGGYESAGKHFRTAQPSDPLLREFTLDNNLWKGAVGDSNVAAQQEALNAYTAFLAAGGAEGARRTRGSTIAPVVEKGLTGRPAAKAAALESLLLLIELDKADPVIEDLLPFLSHKQPKVIAATFSALAVIYHAYGCKTVEPKPVIKTLPAAFGHADKNVRAEAQALTVELYRWLREPMKPLFWPGLKEVQQKDLDKLFEPIRSEPTPRPERLLRSQQAVQEEGGADGDGNGEAAGGDDDDDAGEVDLEPEYEAVDVFNKVPKDFSERLASSKWKDRKEALDELFTAVNVPAMKEGPFDDIIRGCAKSMKDANIAVVTVAANCVECVAKGLKKSFSRYRSTILASMLERFKEKKASVTDAIAAACDAVCAATSLGDITPDVLEALKNKNPQVKEHSTKFLIRSLKTARDPPSLEQTKELAEANKKLLTESAAPLRDAGAEALGVLWKIMGDRNMLTHLEGVDELRKTKIKEFSDTAEVRAKWKPKTAAPAPKPAVVAPPSKKPALGTKKPAPKKAAPQKAASPPPPTEEIPLQSRPTGRPISKGPGALRPPGAGLKAPSAGGLTKPGNNISAPMSATASPKRQGMILDDAPISIPMKSSGLAPPGSRGLAGRPIGKPVNPPAPPSPPPAQASYAPSALSSVERAELSELRAELEILRNTTSDLRQDKARLHSQVAELQNQNAQLIEDHTRDVLQIKAKETQLVRARGDAEGAEERANSLSREIDRLKREMSRLGRGAMQPGMGWGGGRDSPVEPTGGYATNGDSHARTPYARSQAYGAPGARASPGPGVAAADGYGEGKENIPADQLPPGASLKLSPPLSAPPPPSALHRSGRPYSSGSSTGVGGRGTPLSDEGGVATAASTEGLHRSQSGSEGGVESWRRAAEVTQNLKARIEMMKARQNIGRGQ